MSALDDFDYDEERNAYMEAKLESRDLTHLKAVMPYQSAKNRFYGVWNKGYTGKKFKTLYQARNYAYEHGGTVKRFGYDGDGNMVQMKKPQVITEKAEQ